jgi:hypothetical protein
VRKVIRSQATEFRYERGRQPLPRIDPWRDQLDALLLANEEKPARERLTLIRIFEELRPLGYEGSYDAIRRYAKVWRAKRGAAMAEAYVSQTIVNMVADAIGTGRSLLVVRLAWAQRFSARARCGRCAPGCSRCRGLAREPVGEG